MGKPVATDTLSTPTGFRMPMWLYSVALGALITAGSAIFMAKLDYPGWVWPVEFVILSAVCFGFVRQSSKKTGDGNYVVASKRGLICFAGIAAMLLIAAVVIAL